MAYIWDHSTKTFSGELSDGEPLSLGLRFSALKGCTVTHLSFWKTASDAATSRPIRIYDSSGAVLASGTSSGEPVGAAGWVDIALATPLKLGASTTAVYTAVVFHPDKYVALDYGLQDGKYSADSVIYAISNGEDAIGNGRFFYGSTIQNTTGAYHASDYGVDVRYTPDGAASITGSAAIVDAADTASGSITHPVKASGVVADANDTITGAIAHPVKISAAVKDADDVVSSQLAHPISAGASILDDSDAVSATASIKIRSDGAVIDAGDTVASTLAISIVAFASVVDGDDAISSNLRVATSINAVISDADDIVVGTAKLSIRAAGDFVDNDDRVGGGFGFAGSSIGSAAIRDADDIVAGSISVRLQLSGGAAGADDVATGSALARISIAGIIVDQDDRVVSAGNAPATLAAAIVDEDDKLSASASIAITGIGSELASADTVAAIGRLSIVAAAFLLDGSDVARGEMHEIREIIGDAAIVDAGDIIAGWVITKKPLRYSLTGLVASPFKATADIPPAISLRASVAPRPLIVAYRDDDNQRKTFLAKITHFQGDTFIADVVVKDKVGVVSLTGASIVWRLATDAEALAPLIEKTSADNEIIVTDAVNGVFEIRLSAAETAELPARDYFHQARITFASGEVRTVLREYLTIVETV